MRRQAPLQRRTPLQRKMPLRPRSRSESARRRREALAEAVEQAREYWGGEVCLVTGRAPAEWHHAYPRSVRPEWRAAWWNLVPLSPWWHRRAQRPDHWLHWAVREVADEVRAHAEGRRPPVTREEAREIIRRYREEVERPHVSPMGRSD